MKNATLSLPEVGHKFKFNEDESQLPEKFSWLIGDKYGWEQDDEIEVVKQIENDEGEIVAVCLNMQPDVLTSACLPIEFFETKAESLDSIDTTPIQVESLAGGAEWKNGDECIYMSHKVVQQFIGPCPKRYGYGYIQAPTFEVNFVELSKLSKPETEAERNERERLEAAYDLYLTRHVSMPAPYHYDEFLKNERTLDGFLAIVDKTGYRKAVTNG